MPEVLPRRPNWLTKTSKFARTIIITQSVLTPRLYDWSVSSEHLGFLFLFFFISLFCCGSVRQIKLAIC